MGNTIYDEMNVVLRSDLTLEQDDIYKFLHKFHLSLWIDTIFFVAIGHIVTVVLAHTYIFFLLFFIDPGTAYCCIDRCTR